MKKFLIIGVVLSLMLSTAVQAHEPDTISIFGIASPECREVDQSWSIEWVVTNSSPNEFEISGTSPEVDWSDELVSGHTSEEASQEVAAGISQVQILVTHSNEVHGPQSFASNVVDRPLLCPEPTPTSTPEPTSTPVVVTATPVATSTPSPTVSTIIIYCVGNAKVTEINGQVTQLEDPHSDCVTPVVPSPTSVPTGSITPPSTGNAGLLDKLWSKSFSNPFWGGGGGGGCSWICYPSSRW